MPVPTPNPLPFRSLPLELRAGDALTWIISPAGFPPSLYTLSYVLTGVVGGAPVRIAITSGDIVGGGTDYTVTVPSSETKAWTPGRYEWFAYVVDSSNNRTQLATGTVKILPDVAGSVSPIDPRTQNEITLYAINQLIAGRAVSDVQMYEIGGRKLEKMKIQDLMYWRGIVSGWVRQEKKARGEYVRPNSVGITFGGM